MAACENLTSEHVGADGWLGVKVDDATRSKMDAGETIVVALVPGDTPTERDASLRAGVQPSGVATIRRMTTDDALLLPGRPCKFIIDGLGEPTTKRLSTAQRGRLSVALVLVDEEVADD